MTILVSVDQLKARLSEYLEAASRGAIIEITAQDHAIARLVGIGAGSTAALSDLIAEGAVDWSGGKPTGASVTLGEGPPLSDIVVSQRR